MSADNTVELTADLTDLIRIQRREVAGVTQKGAALAAGGMGVDWWQLIESGRAGTAQPETLARMCYAINISPEQLRNIGQARIAELVERRLALLEPAPEEPATAMEDHLLATPGLSEGQRRVLIEVARGLLRAEQDTTDIIAK